MFTARLFTKNVLNYMSMGIGGIADQLHGASAISTSLRFRISSFDTTLNNNRMVSVAIGGSGTGVLVTVHNGTDFVLSCGARSIAADTIAQLSGRRRLSLGRWYHAVITQDYLNPELRMYLEGSPEATMTPTTWSQPSYTVAAVTTADAIGSYAAPPTTANQIDGEVTDVTFYRSNIGPRGARLLADGADPANIGIMPTCLYRLDGKNGAAGPELDSMGNGAPGVITGSIPLKSGPVSPGRQLTRGIRNGTLHR